jgi:hypothetical protein
MGEVVQDDELPLEVEGRAGCRGAASDDDADEGDESGERGNETSDRHPLGIGGAGTDAGTEKRDL